MAKKISELPDTAGVVAGTLIEVVDDPEGTPASAKATAADIAALTPQLTTDGDLLTRAAGVPARITRADLAADAAFAGRYVAKPDEVWFGAERIAPISGATSPLSAAIGVWPAWGFVDSAEVARGVTLWMPDHWTTYSIDIYWRGLAATSGDVQWRTYRQSVDPGDTLTFGTFSTGVVAAAGSQHQLVLTTLASGLAVVSGKLTRVAIARQGAESADTYAGEVGLVGVMLRKAS
jgi:hypothetical protein